MVDWEILGQVLTVFAVLIGGGAGAWAAFKSKGTEAWKNVAEAERERNKQLDTTIREIRAENAATITELRGEKDALMLELADVKQKLAQLQMLPNLSELLAFLREDRDLDGKRFADVIEKLNARFDALEGRIQVEHGKLLELMAAVKDKMEGKSYGRARAGKAV